MVAEVAQIDGVHVPIMGSVAEPLTPKEKRHLGALEKRIERGMATFIDVGLALQEIRDTRLYRETHPNFDSYCRERWQFDRGRAYQLIGAAEVAKVIPASATPIANEAQARELVALVHENPDLVRQVWQEVTKDDAPVSAARIRQVVRQHIPTTEAPPPTPLTPRLVQAFDRLLVAYKEWMATRPGRSERELVHQALDRLMVVAEGKRT
jgi:hypothetical protein